MLTVVSFKWKRPKTGFQLPSVCDYSCDHVNIMARMLRRNLRVPHRFICVTDDDAGIKTGIEVIPLWDKVPMEWGGCYNRLFMYSEEVRPLFGDRFVMLDLDTVITGDVTDLFTMDVDFAANRHLGNARHQYYNGAIQMMRTGSRRQVWDRWRGEESIRELDARKKRKEVSGSDQAWIAHVLGPGERVLGPKDGVYEMMWLDGRIPPPDARLVMFSGRRDPSQKKHKWVKEHWR